MMLWHLRSTLGICEGLYLHGIWAVVLLCITVAKVLVVGYLLVGFLCQWCRTVAEAGCRFLGLVADAAGGVGLAFVVEVEVVVGWATYMVEQMEAFASIPADEEYPLSIGALLTLPLLNRYTRPPGFSLMSSCLPYGDGLLLLVKPFNLLLNSMSSSISTASSSEISSSRSLTWC
jgi:hypothetical protein